MAFLDDISKKITEAGQSAVQKTRDVTDIARLNSMINEEEKAAESLYNHIGKMYVNLHRNDHEEQFAGMIASLNASEGKIQEYKKQIQNIKGISTCEKCGAEVSNHSAFCKVCGAPMPRPVVTPPYNGANLVKCNTCGAMVAENTKFCTNCGGPMVIEAQPVEVKAETGVVCPNCNKALSPEAMFCNECGTKVK